MCSSSSFLPFVIRNGSRDEVQNQSLEFRSRIAPSIVIFKGRIPKYLFDIRIELFPKVEYFVMSIDGRYYTMSDIELLYMGPPAIPKSVEGPIQAICDFNKALKAGYQVLRDEDSPKITVRFRMHRAYSQCTSDPPRHSGS